MSGSTNFAVAFLLADALAIAVSVQIARVFQRGDVPTAISIRSFILVLALLATVAINFDPGLIVYLFLAYLYHTYRVITRVGA